ncbi:hypothetical protein GCM10027258_80720 [Amycolatopsis stemonae]
MSQVLTRDDVFLSEPRTSFHIPGIVRAELTQLTVAGKRYQVQTVKSWLIGDRTVVYPATEALVEQDTANTELVVSALLDVLNSQPADQN